jgi:hypothetical protein
MLREWTIGPVQAICCQAQTRHSDGLIDLVKRTKSDRKAAPEKSARVDAVRLLGRWVRLSQSHVSLSAGCSCGMGYGAVKVQDFEGDILQFLRNRHASLVKDATSIDELLRTVVGRVGTEAKGLLADLERSIDSCEEQHR